MPFFSKFVWRKSENMRSDPMLQQVVIVNPPVERRQYLNMKGIKISKVGKVDKFESMYQLLERTDNSQAKESSLHDSA